MQQTITRRRLLVQGAFGAASAWIASQWPGRSALAASSPGFGLPAPDAVRRDVQRVVDFGPRLTGNDAHNRFCEWLEREFSEAGLQLLPCDTFDTSRWEVGRFGLDVLEGQGAGAVKVATYFPRSKQTSADGVTGPLVYAGSPPQPAVNPGDIGSLQAALARYPSDLASWAQALPGTLSGSPQGSVLLVDVPAPPLLTPGAFLPILTHWQGQGESLAQLATDDYKRLWTVPGLTMPLQEFSSLGVAGVVLIVDASFEALKGQYAPFEWQNEDVPALYVDRDTGAKLRGLAAGRPKVRLTLTATRKTVPTPTVTAILPGASQETLIFNTHTDGQGFVEENGPVAFVALARYFASLPASKRLKRTLVFANWPGHMSNDLPQAQGWIDAHPDLVKRAAAALTVEHLGCTEWNDSLDKGYHRTGRAELFAVWCNQGPLFETVKAATVEHDLPRTALLRPPAQFGVGGPFEQAGIPQIGAIAGPEYLLTISDSGEIEKFDPNLMARQIAWLATIATNLDKVAAASLKAGDPTLGSPSSTGNIEPSNAKPHFVACTPPPAAVTGGSVVVLGWHGRRKGGREVLVSLHTSGATLRGVTLELRRGSHVVSRRRSITVTHEQREFALRRARGARFAPGRYMLVVRKGRRTIARRRVTIS
jgi:hypothetical protein